MLDTPLPERLLALRLSKRLCQKEIASILELPLCSYRSYETGKRTPAKLAMIELIRRVEAMEAQP
jgi:transcriptional regulator with XRE-family HTH domain